MTMASRMRPCYPESVDPVRPCAAPTLQPPRIGNVCRRSDVNVYYHWASSRSCGTVPRKCGRLQRNDFDRRNGLFRISCQRQTSCAMDRQAMIINQNPPTHAPIMGRGNWARSRLTSGTAGYEVRTTKRLSPLIAGSRRMIAAVVGCATDDAHRRVEPHLTSEDLPFGIMSGLPWSLYGG